ncbi:MAG: hypothetical protein JRH18_15995 [Deltaproteobacteria bacterium]|nr:hypothetical protein [Deltaproteobacteria bacterium]MBW2153158.1 hypothetical protein [Deltaproteobacteria bacterium]
MKKPAQFNSHQINIVNESTAMAEELVSSYYKMSDSQWLRPVYDIKTLADLSSDEIVQGPFAQIIRYEGKPGDTALGSYSYDFYKICIQDHSILSALNQFPDIKLFPFSLYIVTHELIHIVRFKKFLQNFMANPREKMIEEIKVHDTTHEILRNVPAEGLHSVFRFYRKWRKPVENMRDTR